MDAAARKAKLGQKWTCYSCSAKFYDMNKPDPHCPKCNADQRQSPAFEKPKRSRAKKAAAPAAPKKAIKPPPPIDEGEDLDTPIDAVYPLTQVHEALVASQERGRLGKVMLGIGR